MTESKGRYSAYRKQERALSEALKIERWAELAEETREEFRQIWDREMRGRALRNYTFAVLGIVAAVVVGSTCIVLGFALSEHRGAIAWLVTVGTSLVVLGWIPAAESASRAKSELMERR